MSLEETIAYIASHLSPRANYFLPGDCGYDYSTTTYYWVSSEESPACVFQPANPKDVAVILSTLSKPHCYVKFAIKGGGHIAPAGFSSTNGILIDMVLFNQVKYCEDTTFVDVGPGLFWERVYTVLSGLKEPRNVPGASTCQKVGVAGFNLGGGFSNLTNQFGLAIDSVRAIEVVIPSGEILTVNEQKNPDLFWALRGGGNNFGIVTNWTMATQPQGPIWSCVLHYQPQYFEALIGAITEFQKVEIPQCNVEAVFEHTRYEGQPASIASVECFFDGKEPPPDVFAAFFAIPHRAVLCTKTWMDRHHALPRNRQTYKVGLPSGKEDIPPFRGRFSSVMVSRYTPELIQLAISTSAEWAQQLASHRGFQIYVDIWPFLRSMFDRSSDSAWPHHKGHPNGPLVINFKWLDSDDDDFWLGGITAVTHILRDAAACQGLTTKSTPMYYNLSLDGTLTSDIYQRHLKKLGTIRSHYDPCKVMDRTGGFRIEF